MTNDYSKNITPDYLYQLAPDSLSGIIFALEGVSRTVVLLNGPTGCKFYHSATSDGQQIRQPEFDPLRYPQVWYFGQPRVPCTYLDAKDYVYGSEDKLKEALEFVCKEVPNELLCIVNSPGAALIGDDLKGIAASITGRPCVIIETPGYSGNISAGHEQAAIELMRQLAPPGSGSKAKKTVNILGLSIYHRNHAGDADELTRLLRLCGIEVNCILCHSCDMESIARVPDAALNIVIHPEYGLETARYLEKAYGTPYYTAGIPIGFAAVEQMITELCTRLNGTDEAFCLESERARGRAFAHISRVNSLTGLPKGVRFAVEGNYSELCSYIAFFTRYYGMLPDCVLVSEPEQDSCREELLTLLEEMNLSEILQRDIDDTNAELVFASGNTIARLRQRGHIFSGIEVVLPSLGYIDVVPKTLLGITGALHLTELVLNGLIF